jgi:hypothetical protein
MLRHIFNCLSLSILDSDGCCRLSLLLLLMTLLLNFEVLLNIHLGCDIKVYVYFHYWVKVGILALFLVCRRIKNQGY